MLLRHKRSEKYRNYKFDFRLNINDLFKTLIYHPYVGRLKSNEKLLHIDMTKSHVKSVDILLTLKTK